MEAAAEVEKGSVEAPAAAPDAELAQGDVREAEEPAAHENGGAEGDTAGPQAQESSPQANGASQHISEPEAQANGSAGEQEGPAEESGDVPTVSTAAPPVDASAEAAAETAAEPSAEPTDAVSTAPPVETSAAAKAEKDGSEPSLAEAQEHRQLPVSERRKAKRHEVFLGGLPQEATEEDVKRTFGRAGQIAEVRLSRDAVTGKSQGCCFVRYTTEAAARRALSELERAQVHGVTVGVLPGEEQDTLFLGNICQTWTKELVKEALNSLEIEDVEDVIFADSPSEGGQNGGFCFVEFFSRTAAAKALPRLQQPDVLFGGDAPVRATWAEPLSEPDAQLMAQVRSVFVDGLPAEWNEAQGESFFAKFGDVESVVLARSIPSAKRGDYGFITFTTRAAALAAIEALHEKEVADGDSAMKLTVALAKPRGKTKGAGGASASEGGEAEEWGVPSDEDVTKGEVTALLEVLKEQTLLHEAGRAPPPAGDAPGQVEGGGAGEAVDGGTGGSGEGDAPQEGAEGETAGAGAGADAEAGAGFGAVARAGATGGVQDAATALKEALARERESRQADAKGGESAGAGAAKGAANGGPKSDGKGNEEAPGVSAKKEGAKEEGGKREREREKFPADKYECGMCGFGSDVEEEYLRHQMSRVHRIIADLRQDEKLNNKTPLSLLNEFAMRNKIEVKYDMKGEGAGPFEVHASLGGGPNCVPDVVGVGAGRQKTRAKQMSAADALDKLMVHIPEAEFTRPGNKNRSRQLGPRGPPAGAFPGRGSGGPYSPGRSPGRGGFGRGGPGGGCWGPDGGGGSGERDMGPRGDGPPFERRMGGYLPGYGRSGLGQPGAHRPPFQPPGGPGPSRYMGGGGDLAEMIRGPGGMSGGHAGGAPGESYAQRLERVQGRHGGRPGWGVDGSAPPGAAAGGYEGAAHGAPGQGPAGYGGAAYSGMKRPLPGEAGPYSGAGLYSGGAPYGPQRPRLDPYAAPPSHGYTQGAPQRPAGQYPSAHTGPAAGRGGSGYGTLAAYSAGAGAGAAGEGRGAGGVGAGGYSSAPAASALQGTAGAGAAAGAGAGAGAAAGAGAGAGAGGYGSAAGGYGAVYQGASGAYGAGQYGSDAGAAAQGYSTSATSYGQYQQYGGAYAQYGSIYQQPTAGTTTAQQQAYPQTTHQQPGTQYQAATTAGGATPAGSAAAAQAYGAAGAYGGTYDYYSTSYQQAAGTTPGATAGAAYGGMSGYGHAQGAQGGYAGAYPAAAGAGAASTGLTRAGDAAAAAAGGGQPGSAVAGGAAGSAAGRQVAAAGAPQQGYAQYGAAQNGAAGGGYY